jgi:hypothetical protein
MWANFLTCAVSAHELAAHNPIFAPCLRVEYSHSRLRFRDEFDDCVVGSQFDTVSTTQSPETHATKSASEKAVFAAISRVWWSPISGLCAETRLQAPFGAPVSGGKNPVPNSKRAG